jgi:S-adenosylmethionine synthetase
MEDDDAPRGSRRANPMDVHVGSRVRLRRMLLGMSQEKLGEHLGLTFQQVARKAIKDIGYEQDGFHWKTAKIEVLLHGQSADIAQGVDAPATRTKGGRPGHHVRLCLPRDA